MYGDPALIRKHRVNLNLSDYENELLDRVCAFTGEQKGTLLREMLVERLAQVLHDQANSENAELQMPGAIWVGKPA